MKSSHGGHSTSIVVRSCRCGKLSFSPRSLVDMAQCESVICMWSGMVMMCETSMNATRSDQVGMLRHTGQ